MSLHGTDMETQTYHFVWQGIEMEAVYAPRKFGIIAHLEIRSISPERAPLSITDTGYLSHFHAPGTIEVQGDGVVVQLIAWLDEEAASPEWQRYQEARRQGELF